MTDDALRQRVRHITRRLLDGLDIPGAMDVGANGDGTYHLGRTMSALTKGRISSDEVMWTAQRLQDLIRGGMTADEAKEIVAREARLRPWEAK